MPWLRTCSSERQRRRRREEGETGGSYLQEGGGVGQACSLRLNGGRVDQDICKDRHHANGSITSHRELRSAFGRYHLTGLRPKGQATCSRTLNYSVTNLSIAISITYYPPKVQQSNTK